jgi:hypothetical protein
MVAPIDPTATAARLAALLQQAAGTARRVRDSNSAGGAAYGSATRPAATVPHATAGAWQAAETLKSRVNAISRDHPDRRRAVRRLLIEVMLTREFGSEFAADQAFQTVIDEVLRALDGVPALCADLERVVAHLLEGR